VVHQLGESRTGVAIIVAGVAALHLLAAAVAGGLLDRAGRERGRWLGAFDPTGALTAARDL